jgi:hypothetical protein
LKFETVPLADVSWAHLDAFADRTFSQRRGWLEFIRDAKRGEIVVARLVDAGQTAGYFSGIVIRRRGVRIMGSPLPGWTTRNLGFNLAPGVARADAVAALLPFVFRELGCLHLELADPLLTRADVEPFGFRTSAGTTFLSDLTGGDDAILTRLSGATRRNIRKAERSGVTIEEAAPDGFSEEFYGHLIDVFAKQQLRPTYDRARVEGLIRHVHPGGDLLLLRARGPDGRSIASAIYAGYNGHSYFWGNGSLREYQILRPNEPLHLYAMTYWRERGFRFHDWGGAGDYKAKYGGVRTETRHHRLSRFAAIGLARDLARTGYYLPRRLKQQRHLRRVGRMP